MIEFFLNVIIVTGGVICIIAWLATFLELADRFSERKNHKSIDIDLEG